MSLSRILISLALLVTAVAAPAAVASTSHEGWPPRSELHLWMAGNHGSHHTGTRHDDELLGGHGSDWLSGGAGRDVIWGDQHAGNNDTWQHDTLIGGAGRDFIYASHGHNDIYAGPGNDVIHAHFGTGGVIDCGSGHDVVYLSHRTRALYHLRHCERVSYATVGH